MKALYLDCFSGISGNMLLGAFLDAGVPEDILRQQLALLPIDGYKLLIERVVKNGISAQYVRVELTHDHHHHRHLSDIYQIIDRSLLDSKVKEDSKKIFLILAQAEAKVHGTTVEAIHFHEVGAVDAIIDIVGAALGIHYLGIEAMYTSKLQVGSGFVQCCHGLMPVPAPATVELLKNIPYYHGTISKELVTPTGAAIIAALGVAYGDMPENFISHGVGYGAGTWDLPIPNVLRMHIGEIELVAIQKETMVVEANIDDSSPQIFPYIMDTLLAMGVLDVWLTPIVMKKNRMATKLSVLLNSPLLPEVITLLFQETSTIGLRYYEVKREMMERAVIDLDIPLGTARVKISSYNGTICSITPEYEDCKRLAQKSGRPLKEIQQAFLEAARSPVR